MSDNLWAMTDAQLVELAAQKIVRLGLGVEVGDVKDECFVRQYKAYPVYDGSFRRHLQVLQDYTQTFESLQVVGRIGRHGYNN